MSNAGRLTERITLQRATRTADGGGGTTQSWSTLATVWAEAKPRGGREGLTEGRIAAEGAQLGVDFARTWSCYKGGAVHCGKCGTCVERREAFILAGLKDPTVYMAIDPLPQAPGDNHQ